MKNRKIKLFETNVGCDLINMVKVLDQVRKLKIIEVWNPKYKEFNEVSICGFSTCRSEGFVITNYGMNKAVGFSNDRGSDEIRVFSGRPSDFEDREDDGNIRHDNVRNWSRGRHSVSGPWNPRIWDTVKNFEPNDHKKAAQYIVKELNTDKLPVKPRGRK